MSTTRFSTFIPETFSNHYIDSLPDYIGEATLVYGSGSHSPRSSDHSCSIQSQLHTTTLNNRCIEEQATSVEDTKKDILKNIQQFHKSHNENEQLNILEALHVISKIALNQYTGDNLIQIASFLNQIVFGGGLHENCHSNEKIAFKKSIPYSEKITPETLRNIIKLGNNITPAVHSKAWDILNSLFPENKEVDCIMKFYPRITLQRLLQKQK